MTMTKGFLLALLAVLPSSALAQGQGVGLAPLVLRDVTLIDGTGAPPRPATTVVVRDGRVAVVGPTGEVTVPPGARIIDGTGRYLLPGLWDLHVHLAKAGEHTLPLFVANGVTTVRDMGGDAVRVAAMKAAVGAGERVGPRILMAGPIAESAAYMRSAEERNLVEPVERFRVGVGSPDRARRVVDSIAALGADFVKFRTVDSIATYRALARATRDAGLDLVGHAQNLPAEEVLRARQRTVEHVLFPFLTDRDPAEAADLARRFAEAGTVFVPTLVTFTRSALVPTDSLAALLTDAASRREPRMPYLAGFLIDDWREQLEERIAEEEAGDALPWEMLHARQLDDLRLLHAAGAAILPGTDVAVLGVFPGSTLHDELELLVELVGLSPKEAIEGATRRSAELLGLADELGTIEPGKTADLILLDADPLADIRNTRRIAAVVRGGVHYDRGDRERLHRWVAHQAEALRSAPNRIPSGRYELEAAAGGRVFSAELELVAVEGRPWGRLTVGAVGVVTAVRGIAADGDTWTFAAGGPVRSVRLTFADEVSGTLELGDAPPVTLNGRRAGDVADPGALRAHHVLDPLGLAVRAGEEGASFPTGTPDGRLIFARHGPDLSRQTLMIADPAGEGWGQPEVMALSGTYSDRSPAVLPDGSGLVFASDRPNGGDGEPGQYRLWFAPRLDGGAWSAPRPAELTGGWPHDARQPSVTADGSLYFSSDAPGGSGEGDLYSAAHLAPGRWSVPRNVGAPVNNENDEHGAVVAPDRSYMVLTSSRPRPDGQGDDDLWVSFPTGEGWSNPVPLPLPVNTFANEYGAWVSPVDGRLYFTSDRYGYAALFRVDADLIRVPPAPPSSNGGTERAHGTEGGEEGMGSRRLGRSAPDGGPAPPSVCLLMIALTAGCSEPESPFSMWDMRVGMPFAELDSISLHDQRARYTCVRSLLGYRTCSVPLRGSPGRMDALVDSTGTVVELTFWTGSDHMVSNVLSDGGRSYELLQGLYRESLRLAGAWRDVTDSDTVYSDEVGWTETWLAGEDRWIARIVWQGTGQPSMIRTADAGEAHRHALAVARAESGVDRSAPRPTASRSGAAIGSELRRLVAAQRAFRDRSGRYADALAPLHFIPRDGVLVEIGGARPAGWWARGWDEDGRECVVWDGVPPPRADDFQGQAGGPVCS